MKKWLFVLILVSQMVGMTVISTEQDIVPMPEATYEMLPVMTQNEFLDSVPTNPNVYHTVMTFSDKNLTQAASDITPNTKFVINRLVVNDKSNLVFELSDGTYALASRQDFYDDTILNQSSYHVSAWLKEGFKVYTSPVANQTKLVSTSLSSYQQIQLTDIATTPLGEFVKTTQGWLKFSDVSLIDNRMEKVQQLLDSKYQNKDYAIYVKQLSTDKVAAFNANHTMYGASVWKLSVLYYTQLLLDKKEIKLTDTYQYIPEVNKFSGSYEPAGSGSMPKEADNKMYSLEELINKTAKESDNVASNMLSYYVAHKLDNNFKKAVAEITGNWDTDDDMTVKVASDILESLASLDGQEVLTSLSATQFDNQRIPKDLSYRVAHKIGDAYDYRHDAAIVYVNSPYILVIFTEHSDYDKISEISKAINDILK